MRTIASMFFIFLVITANVYGQKKLKPKHLTKMLVSAIQAKDVSKVKEVLDAGADPNEIRSAGLFGNCDIITLLAERGAVVDHRKNYCLYTILCELAIVETWLEPSEEIKANSEFNAKLIPKWGEERCKKEGWLKPTDSTLFNTKAERMRTLLELGADPNVGQGNFSDGPFVLAVQTLNLEYIQTYISYSKVKINFENRFNQHNENLLKFAAWGQPTSLKDAKKYYGNGKEVRDWTGVPGNNTALLYAVEKQNLSLVKMLVEAGADIDNGKKIKDWGGNLAAYLTPLDLAVDIKNKEIVDYLTSKGAGRLQK